MLLIQGKTEETYDHWGYILGSRKSSPKKGSPIGKEKGHGCLGKKEGPRVLRGKVRGRTLREVKGVVNARAFQEKPRNYGI